MLHRFSTATVAPLRTSLDGDSGNALIEYGLLVAIIALGCVVVLYTFGPILLNIIYNASIAVYNAWPH